MQDYIDLAKKNGIVLLETGKCQFCGADTKRGVHECVELYSNGFEIIDFSRPENHRFRFLSVDAHALQHPEIHGRWSNHFHLSRLHLIFEYNVDWTYQLSPKLSDHLNKYKKNHGDEFLPPPKVQERGTITTTDITKALENEGQAKAMIQEWALAVYTAWSMNFSIVDTVSLRFLNEESVQ